MSTAISPSLRTPRPKPQTDYSQLLKTIQQAGLMKRRYGYYAVKCSLMMLAVLAIGTGIVVLGDSWWQLVLAALLGLVFAQFGFLGHDAAHRQIFVSGKANHRAGLVLGTLFSGMSLVWWNSKHNKHHQAPNQISKDPDIAPMVLHFYPVEPKPDRSRFSAFCRARQGWLFFPLLTLEGVNLHAQSVITSFGRGSGKRQPVEMSLLLLRWTAYLTLLLLVLDPGKAAAFLGVQLVVVGVYLGCTFAPNHKGMPVLPADARIDFLRRQVLMSRNIISNRLTTFAMGGLNYQIEHHLFPSMPRPNLRRAQRIIKPFCIDNSVDYTETTLRRSYGIVVRYLNQVGLNARDPFDCPIVASLRPRV
jgi:fatty acid desaturase